MESSLSKRYKTEINKTVVQGLGKNISIVKLNTFWIHPLLWLFLWDQSLLAKGGKKRGGGEGSRKAQS